MPQPGAAPPRVRSGEHERHLATGALAQQVSQVLGTLIMLAVVTVLGRSLSLSEFGTYGLVVASATYLLLVQTSVEAAVVRAAALARDQFERDRAFSTGVVLYLSAGLLTGSIVAGGGWLLVGVLGIPHRLQDDAQIGVLILGGVIFAGWPLRIFQDLLRASQRFVDSAVAELAGYVMFGAGTIAMVAAGAPLWLLIGFGGTIPALTGLSASAAVLARRLPFRVRRGAVSPGSIREFVSLSGYLLIGGATDLVVYALDRVLLAAFRSAAVVGLYEGPVRAHNLVRQIHGTLVGVVLPAASRYVAEKDEMRLRELMLRGTRYVLAGTVPVVVTLMVLAGPLLRLWLGAKFGVAAAALAILVGYWLINANTGVAIPMMVAGGYARWLAGYAWAVAIASLVASVLLTWQFGLNGVVLGTTIPMALMFPVFLGKALRSLPFTLAALVRRAWVPAYLTGAALAAVLVVVRLTIPIVDLAELLGLLIGGPLAYWLAFYLVWATDGERALIRDLIHGAAVRTGLLRLRPGRP